MQVFYKTTAISSALLCAVVPSAAYAQAEEENVQRMDREVDETLIYLGSARPHLVVDAGYKIIEGASYVADRSSAWIDGKYQAAQERYRQSSTREVENAVEQTTPEPSTSLWSKWTRARNNAYRAMGDRVSNSIGARWSRAIVRRTRELLSARSQPSDLEAASRFLANVQETEKGDAGLRPIEPGTQLPVAFTGIASGEDGALVYEGIRTGAKIQGTYDAEQQGRFVGVLSRNGTVTGSYVEGSEAGRFQGTITDNLDRVIGVTICNSGCGDD